MNKFLLIILVILALIGGGYYYYQSQQKSTSVNPQMDSMEMNQKPSTKQSPTEATSSDSAMKQDNNSSVKEFTVEGKNFSFTPNKLTVSKGDTVKITFKNNDGMHDLVLDEFNVKTDVIKSGEEQTVTFKADKAGTFEYYCSVGNHRAMGMFGKLIVK